MDRCSASYATLKPGGQVAAPLGREEFSTQLPDLHDAHGLHSLPAASVPVVPGYRIHQILGRGSEGFVFRASRPGDPDVAIKVTKRAEAEFKALTAVHKTGHRGARYVLHPEKVVGDHLLSEIVEFRLSDLFTQEGLGITQGRADRILGQVRAALEAVHAAGLVHGDVKPGNILVMKNGDIRLADFGITVRAGVKFVGAGTPRYASENQRDLGTATAADDWHSFGILEKEVRALVGKPPISDEDVGFVERNLGLAKESFLIRGVMDWPAFHEAAWKRAGEMDPFLNPRTVGILTELTARIPARPGSVEVPVESRLYRFPLALHPAEQLTAARAMLEKRFDSIRELAKEKEPDWEKIADLLFSPSEELAALGVKTDGHTGGVQFDVRSFRNMKSEQDRPSALRQPVIRGEDRPGWFRSTSTVIARSKFEVETVGMSVPLNDPRLLEIQGIRGAVLRTRKSLAYADVLIGLEEYGHLLQDLRTLTDGGQSIAEPLLKRIQAKHPGLVVDRTPLNHSFSSGAAVAKATLLEKPNQILYTREADVYLHMVSVLGKKHVPDEWATYTSYPERLNLFRLLPD